MLDRTTGLLLTIGGTLLVALLLVVGVDIHRAAQTGPRWRRRLVGAGIMLLATLGMTGCDPTPQVTCYAPRPVSDRQGTADELQQRAGALRDAVERGAIGADTLTVTAANISAEMDSLIQQASDTEREGIRRQLAVTAGLLEEAHALAVVAGRSPLGDDERWEQLTVLTSAARLAGSGKLGPYPFDRAEQQRLLQGLTAGGATLAELQRDGLLNAAEQQLLAQELQYLYRQVSDKRPVEMQMATCYEPMMYLPGRDGLRRLAARIDWLEQAATEQTLHPEALRAALGTIEDDCALLNDPARRGQMTSDELKQASVITGRVKKALAALAAR